MIASRLWVLSGDCTACWGCRRWRLLILLIVVLIVLIIKVCRRIFHRITRLAAWLCSPTWVLLINLPLVPISTRSRIHNYLPTQLRAHSPLHWIWRNLMLGKYWSSFINSLCWCLILLSILLLITSTSIGQPSMRLMSWLFKHLSRLWSILVRLLNPSLIFLPGIKILPVQAIGMKVNRLVEDFVCLLCYRLYGVALSIQWLSHV